MVETYLVFVVACFAFSLIAFVVAFSQRRHEKRWYVRYPDGYRTYLMSLPDAKTYREIFGGVVYKDGKEKLPEVKKDVAPICLLQ